MLKQKKNNSDRDMRSNSAYVRKNPRVIAKLDVPGSSHCACFPSVASLNVLTEASKIFR
jgi:hypothetical protein